MISLGPQKPVLPLRPPVATPPQVRAAQFGMAEAISTIPPKAGQAEAFSKRLKAFWDAKGYPSRLYLGADYERTDLRLASDSSESRVSYPAAYGAHVQFFREGTDAPFLKDLGRKLGMERKLMLFHFDAEVYLDGQRLPDREPVALPRGRTVTLKIIQNGYKPYTTELTLNL